MGGVTTGALIERRPDISRSLFTRYWRDVHGVMAARIPGFDRYTQHHVSPLDPAAEPFEGIAIVTYRTEEARARLIHSEVPPHIHRDEPNVLDRKSTRLNSSHYCASRKPSTARKQQHTYLTL